MRRPRRVRRYARGPAVASRAFTFSMVPSGGPSSKTRCTRRAYDGTRRAVLERASSYQSSMPRAPCCETAIAGQPQEDPLEGRADRARVGDVVTEVHAAVRAADHDVGRSGQTEHRERTQSLGVPATAKPTVPDGRSTSSTPIVGCSVIARETPSGWSQGPHGDVAERGATPPRGRAAPGVDAVVVCEEDPHTRHSG